MQKVIVRMKSDKRVMRLKFIISCAVINGMINWHCSRLKWQPRQQRKYRFQTTLDAKKKMLESKRKDIEYHAYAYNILT